VVPEIRQLLVGLNFIQLKWMDVAECADESFLGSLEVACLPAGQLQG
jgi:hypothetical protein